MNTEITQETCLNVICIKYTWKISDFSLCNKKYIRSPLFHAKDLTEFKWYLQLQTTGATSSDNDDFVSVSVCLSKCSKSVISARSNLKLLNHKMESSCISSPDVICRYQPGAHYKFNNFVARKYLTTYRSMILPDDTLTIVCNLKVNEGTYCHKQTDALENKLPAYKLKVLKDFEYLLEDKIMTDVTIITCNASFKAHKAILAARSSVFEEILKHLPKADEDVIRVSDVTSASLGRLLKFMYSGKIDNIENGTEDLIYVADKYGVNDLKALCEDALCRQLNPSNAVHMMKLAQKYRAPWLRRKAIKIMVSELKHNNKNNFNLDTITESKIPHLILAFNSLQQLVIP